MVTPFVVILFGDFARLQHGSGLLPGTEHLLQPGSILVLPHIDLIQDDPLLTCRLENGENPIRIVCDTDLRTPITSKIIKTANDIKTYIATSSIDESKIALYRKCGCEIIYTKKKGNHIDLMNLMQCLGNMQIDSLLLEGGSAMNWSALEQQIVDEVQIYIAPKIFGGSAKSPVSGQGVAFPNDAIMLKPYAFSQVGNDYFIESEVIYPCLQE